MYPPHHYGGYELVWESAVDHLREAGHDVRVLATDTRTDATAPDCDHVFRELRWSLVNGDFVPLSVRQRIALARHNHRVLAHHLSGHRPQAVAWWSMGGLTLTMLETVRRQRVPAVAFVHDDWLDYGLWADSWLHMFRGRRPVLSSAAEALIGIPASVDFGSAARYLFVSEHTRRHAEAQGLELRQTAVAPSGVHPQFIDPVPSDEWEWRLLYVGRLDPRKGVDTAVEALAALPSQARLELAGGWDTREEGRLRVLAEQRGVLDRVRFLGQLDRAQIRAAYARCNVVVFPVVWEEPWGLVPIEAMGRGRLVVATGRGGSGEYLRDGENCLLFPAGDHTALARAVSRLAEDPVLRDRLRGGGLRTAPRHTETIFNRQVEEAILSAAASIR